MSLPDAPSGVYTLPPSYKVANGDLTDASQHNPPFEDVQQALTNRLHRDGRTAWTGNQNANGFRLTGLTEGTASGDAATVGQAAAQIGDFKFTAVPQNSNWLRLNGGVYDIAAYPDLAALFPALPDGVTFTNHAITGGPNINKILAADDKLVAVGDGGKIYVSEDRENWEEKASGTSENLIDIAYGNGVWCAIAQDKTTCISSDADTWTNGTVANLSSALCITFGNNLFVVGGDPNGLTTSGVVTSSDAVTWSSDKIGAGVGGGIWAIAWNGTMFLTGGQGGGASNVAYRSTDGDTWNSAVTGTNIQFKDIATDGTTFVMVGNSGAILSTTNGTVFTPRTSGTTNVLNGVDYSPTSGWMIVGNGGVVRISSNATSWTSVASGTASNLNTVQHDPNDEQHYVIGGASGLILDALRTMPDQFQVPNVTTPPGGWVRAL